MINSSYKTHPRILEIRLMLIFNNLVRNYQYAKAIRIVEVFCDLFAVNFKNILTIVNNDYKIRRMRKTNKERWLQEVVFMGELYDESRYFIAENYLARHGTYLYSGQYNLKIENFVDHEWLRGLDSSVTICGIPHQKLEAERFIIGLEQFLKVLGRLSVP